MKFEMEISKLPSEVMERYLQLVMEFRDKQPQPQDKNI